MFRIPCPGRFPAVFCALAVLAMPGPAQARHVVIAVVDGPRAGEFLEEPGLPHAPVCGSILIPGGAHVPAFLALGWTHTMNGHAAIITGTRQDLVNDGSERPGPTGPVGALRVVRTP